MLDIKKKKTLLKDKEGFLFKEDENLNPWVTNRDEDGF